MQGTQVQSLVQELNLDPELGTLPTLPPSQPPPTLTQPHRQILKRKYIPENAASAAHTPSSYHLLLCPSLGKVAQPDLHGTANLNILGNFGCSGQAGLWLRDRRLESWLSQDCLCPECMSPPRSRAGVNCTRKLNSFAWQTCQQHFIISHHLAQKLALWERLVLEN